jgi:dihydroxyacetone synthase
MQPTRKSSGQALQALVPDIPDFFVGSADLMGACYVTWKDQEEFQNPKTGYGTYNGRQIRYGIREHAMAALANGERAYFPQHKDSDGGGILPVTATFYAFTSYGTPAIRMGALQSLKTIHIATHDGIGLGEDGPTHQPSELDCSQWTISANGCVQSASALSSAQNRESASTALRMRKRPWAAGSMRSRRARDRP